MTAALDGTARSQATAVTVTVADGTAESPGDYGVVEANLTLTIAMGASSETGTLTITPVSDSVHEPDETVRVSGSAED